MYDTFTLTALYAFNMGDRLTTLVRLEETALVSNHSMLILTNKKWP